MSHTEDHVDGSVKKEIVLHVLKAHGISVIYNGDQIVLSKDHITEVQIFSDYVHRRMIQRLAHKFGVQVHYFYHPDSLTPPQP